MKKLLLLLSGLSIATFNVSGMEKNKKYEDPECTELHERAKKYRLGKLLEPLPYEMLLEILEFMPNKFDSTNGLKNFDWFLEFSKANETNRKAVFHFSKITPIRITICEKDLTEKGFNDRLNQLRLAPFFLGIKYSNYSLVLLEGNYDMYKSFGQIKDVLEILFDKKKCSDNNPVENNIIEADFSEILLGNNGLETILPFLQNITILDLNKCDISGKTDEAQADLLNFAKAFHGKKLSLTLNEFGTKGLEALIPALQNIESLVISNCKISGETDKELLIILEFAKAFHGKILDLFNNPLGTKGLVALIPALQNVEALDLSDCGISDETEEDRAGLQKFAIAFHGKKLNLFHNPLGINGLVALIPALKNVEEFDVLGCEISCKTDKDRARLQEFAKAFLGKKLNLSVNPLGPKGLVALIPALTNVEALNLSNCGISCKTDEDRAGLQKFAIAFHGKILGISWNKLGTKGLVALIPALTNIEELTLHHKCGISCETDEDRAGLQKFAIAFHGKKLDISGNNLSKNIRESLQKSLPKTKIEF